MVTIVLMPLSFYKELRKNNKSNEFLVGSGTLVAVFSRAHVDNGEDEYRYRSEPVV